MAFFKRKSLQKKNDDDRAQIIDDLRDALKVPQMTRVHHAIISLTTQRHFNNPEVPFVISGAIESIAQRDLDKGISLALYALSNFPAYNLERQQDTDLPELLTDKAFSLIDRADRMNMKQMAGVAMLAHVIANAHADDSETGRRAQKEWQSAFDILANDKKEGLQYAFAAASNAALTSNTQNTMQFTAMKAWKKAVGALAATDKQAAIKEATRVADGYTGFGVQADHFRHVARDALKKISI